MKSGQNSLITVVLCLLAFEVCAQDDPRLEQIRANSALEADLTITADGGLVAESLSDLVRSSSVIVLGRYGAVVSNGVQYPFDANGNARREAANPNEIAELGGLPSKVIEIEIDEIIKGNDILLGGGTLQLALTESADEDEIARLVPSLKGFRSGEHLFFLSQEFDLRRIM